MISKSSISIVITNIIIIIKIIDIAGTVYFSITTYTIIITVTIINAEDISLEFLPHKLTESHHPGSCPGRGKQQPCTWHALV